MIVEATNYYAKPGLEEEVLLHRRNGNRVREAIGLKPGRIFVKAGDKGPDVRWECAFETEAEWQADLTARDRSEAFAAQRNHMSSLLDSFERHILHSDEDVS